ncbi:ankyrin repeat-containing protein, partial [Colletotrichum zoysiae]
MATLADSLVDSHGLLVVIIACLVAVALSRQTLQSLLSSPPPRPKSLTFRVDDIPSDHSDDFVRRIRSILEQDPVLREVAASVALRSLVPRDEITSCATVSVVTHLSGDSLCMRLTQAGRAHPYSYSCNFEGLTPLYEAEGGADVDIIAVPGLGSHALGSWKSPNGDQVWLRDFLPKEIPTIRVLLYGYDTVLPGSLSKQSIKDLGNALLERITAFREGDDTNRRPIVFVGHSLGGLLIKEALVQARRRRSEIKSDFSKATFGLLFFGVPNLGLRNEQLRTLVRGQPNEGLINDLLVDDDSEPSSYLKGLADQFSETCRDYYRVVSFFERSLSPTIELGKDGEWRKTGRPSLLVTGDSATSTGLVAAADEDNIPLNTDHSGLVKFNNKSQGDYSIVRERIKKLSREAKVEVAKRFARHDLYVQHSAESEACLNSLAFPDIYGRQNSIEPTVAGTCDWIFSHQSFLQWTEQKQGLLWIMGKPGSGKSTILKHALHKAPYLYGPDTVVVSFFFHGRGNEMQKNQLGLFRSLLHQLLWQVPGALSDLVDAYKQKTRTIGKHGEEWDWDLLTLRGFLESALPRVLKRLPVIIFIDALDECGEGSAVQLIQYLKALLASFAPTEYRLRICFSCRYYPVVNSKHGLNILLDKENQADIITYVQTKFNDDPDEHIEDLIVRHADGVFMWAQFVVERVLQLKRQGEPRSKIEAEVMKTPQDLEDFYHGLIEKVQNRVETLRLAQWICFSTRPLTTDELSWAMAYQLDCTYRSIEEWRNSETFITPNNMDTRLKFLSCGLAEIVISGRQRVVQFIHQSVKDYFINRGLPFLDTKLETDALVVPTANRLLAWCCVCYLNLAFSPPPMTYDSWSDQWRRGLLGFLDYAESSWISHMKIGEPVEESPKKFLSLLEWPGGSLIWAWASAYQDPTSEHIAPETTVLALLSRYGLPKLLSCLILDANDSHFDLRDKITGITPLSYAARYGHAAVVELLLKTGKVNV